MKRLPFDIADGPERRDMSAVGRRAPFYALWALALLAFGAGSFKSFGTTGSPRDEVLAMVPGPVMDLVPLGPARPSEIRPIEAVWRRDFDTCARRLTGGGHFSKSSGIVRASFGRPASPRERALIEPRMVACLAAGKPGKFCVPAYRAQFVEFARASLVRVTSVRGRGTLYAEAATPILREAATGLLRTGVVQPRDFRDLVRGHRAPALVTEIAEATGVPRRPC